MQRLAAFFLLIDFFRILPMTICNNRTFTVLVLYLMKISLIVSIEDNTRCWSNPPWPSTGHRWRVQQSFQLIYPHPAKKFSTITRNKLIAHLLYN